MMLQNRANCWVPSSCSPTVFRLFRLLLSTWELLASHATHNRSTATPAGIPASILPHPDSIRYYSGSWVPRLQQKRSNIPGGSLRYLRSKQYG